MISLYHLFFHLTELIISLKWKTWHRYKKVFTECVAFIMSITFHKFCDQQYVCLNGVSLSYCAVDIAFKLIAIALYLRDHFSHSYNIVFIWSYFNVDIDLKLIIIALDQRIHHISHQDNFGKSINCFKK